MVDPDEFLNAVKDREPFLVFGSDLRNLLHWSI